MASTYVFTVTLPYSPDPNSLVNSGQPRSSLMRVAKLLQKVGSGGVQTGGSSFVSDAGTNGATAASATVTFAGLLAADTVTVGNQVFTASASPSGANQFALGASDSAAATNLAAAINAHTALTGMVTAAAASTVVTVTAAIPGQVGNGVTFTSSNQTRAATTGSGNLASGASTRTTFTY